MTGHDHDMEVKGITQGKDSLLLDDLPRGYKDLTMDIPSTPKHTRGNFIILPGVLEHSVPRPKPKAQSPKPKAQSPKPLAAALRPRSRV